VRIALITPGFPVASETFVVDLFEGLLAKGHDVRVICSKASSADRELFARLEESTIRARIRRGWPIRPVPLAVAMIPVVLLRCLANAPSRTLRYLVRGWRTLGPRVAWKLITDAEVVIFGPDLVHLQFGTLARTQAYIGELLGCAVVASFQGADINFGGLGTPGYYDDLWRRAHGIHFSSRDLLARAVRRGMLPDGREAVINPSVDARVFAPQPRPPRGERPLRVLSVGRLHWKKGYEHALVSIRRLQEAGIQTEYRIIGEGEYREAIEATARELGVDDRVCLLGRQPALRVREEMQDADVLLHAAVSEGFCIVALEAQAMQLPVVASDADGLPDNVVDGETGFVVPRRDPIALAERVAVLAHNDGLRRQMGESGRRRALARFAPEARIEAFERLYRDALALAGCLPRRPGTSPPADTGR
jgi:colanic acid/amylovoran biosynthesis glycosyltransferase